MARYVDKEIQLSFQSDYADSVGNQYRLRLNESLNYVKSIRLISYSIPWTFYNINSGNNVLKVQIGEDQKTAMLGEGNYTYINITSALATALHDATGLTWTVTFIPISSKLKFTCVESDYTLLFAGSTIAPLLGLTADLGSATKIATLHNSIDLLPTKEIYIHVNGIQNIGVDGRQDDTSIQVLSLAGFSYGDYIWASDRLAIPSEPSSSTVSELWVSFTNQNGEYIDFRGHPLFCRFVLSYRGLP
jgi:hypothetical protein